MTTGISERRRANLICLAFLGLAVRVVMPAGYMPAPLAEGGPFVLCPDGFFSSTFTDATDAAPDDHHGHAANDAADIWKFCPFGFVFGSSAPATELAFAVDHLRPALPAFGDNVSIRSAVVLSYDARAPPKPQSLDA